MFGSLGWEELLVIFAILALLFGASRVGELGGALGRGIREFRSEASKPRDDQPAEAAAKAEAAAPAQVVAPEQQKQAELLAGLDKLKTEGLLTDAEYQAKREALLARV